MIYNNQLFLLIWKLDIYMSSLRKPEERRFRLRLITETTKVNIGYCAGDVLKILKIVFITVQKIFVVV